MNLIRASILGLTALCAGCASDEGPLIDELPLVRDPLLSLDHAEHMRVQYATYDQPRYRSHTRDDLSWLHSAPPPLKRTYARTSRLAETLEPSTEPATDPVIARPVLAKNTPPASTATWTDMDAHCGSDVDQCRQRLSNMLADTARVWVFAIPDAFDYATGVRMQAFGLLHGVMSCSELQIGLLEAKATRDKAAAALKEAGIAAEIHARHRTVDQAVLIIEAGLSSAEKNACAVSQ